MAQTHSKEEIDAMRKIIEQYDLRGEEGHQEYPRLVYRGAKTLAVNNDQELAAAEKKGYSKTPPIPKQDPAEDE